MLTSVVAGVSQMFETGIAEELGVLPLEGSDTQVPRAFYPVITRGPSGARRGTQALFAPITTAAPVVVPAWFRPVHPHKVSAPKKAIHRSFFAPDRRPFNPTADQGVIPFVQPQKILTVPRKRPFQSFFHFPRIIENPAVMPIGPAGVATIVLDVESGAQVTYSWASTFIKKWSGAEQRQGTMRMPRESYRFTSILTDAQQRRLLSKLAGNAADAATWLLGLSHEAITVASSSGTTILVDSTTLALCDWARAGQRVVVLHPDGIQQLDGVIKSAGGGVIVTDVDMSTYAVAGAQIMPVMAVWLEPTQPMGRYVQQAGRWELHANARLFWSAFGTGATVNTYDGMPVWDWGIGVEGDAAAQPLYAGTVPVDAGIKRRDMATWAQADWGRSVRIATTSQLTRQWLKAFLRTVRGTHVAFLLPTGRPDLVAATGRVSGTTLNVQAPPVAEAPQYVQDWFASTAHRRLRLVGTDGTVAYRTVSSALDNGDGTQSLTLTASLTMTIDHIEFLETARLESNDVVMMFEGPRTSCSLGAQVVQA